MAVVKSGRRNPSTMGAFSKSGETERSTVAPPGTVPEVGWFFCTRVPDEATSKPPAWTDPCATAYTLPSGPVSGVMSRTPPASERALPMELTDTSMRVPGRENEGSSAVTITAAVLRTRTSRGSTRMPRRPSMPLMDWEVK